MLIIINHIQFFYYSSYFYAEINTQKTNYLLIERYCTKLTDVCH